MHIFIHGNATAVRGAGDGGGEMGQRRGNPASLELPDASKSRIFAARRLFAPIGRRNINFRSVRPRFADSPRHRAYARRTLQSLYMPKRISKSGRGPRPMNLRYLIALLSIFYRITNRRFMVARSDGHSRSSINLEVNIGCTCGEERREKQLRGSPLDRRNRRYRVLC